MKRLTLALLMLSAAHAGCGDDDGSTGTSAGGAAGNAGVGGGGGSAAGPPADSCVRPGDTGNGKGIGEYCTPGGGECGDFPEASLCLADVGQDQWFCTRIGCDETTDCGEGAECLLDGAGSACVPCRCSDHCGGGTGGGGTGGGGTGGGGTGGGGTGGGGTGGAGGAGTGGDAGGGGAGGN